jgi:hypothetical protein
MKTAQAIEHAFGRFPRAAGVKEFCDMAASEIHEEPEVGLNHYWFPDGSTLTIQGNRLTADVATKDHAIELLRRLVKWANNQPECYVQGLSLNELQNLYRAHSECDWNYGLDRWSPEQRAEGARTGKAPTFEGSEPLEFKVSEHFLTAIFYGDEFGPFRGRLQSLARMVGGERIQSRPRDFQHGLRRARLRALRDYSPHGRHCHDRVGGEPMRPADFQEVVEIAPGVQGLARYWFEEETDFAPNFDDAQTQAEVRERIARSEPFAWYTIRCEVECEGFTSCDFLGGCSEADDATIEDALATARDHDLAGEAARGLKTVLGHAVGRGQRAAELLARIGGAS